MRCIPGARLLCRLHFLNKTRRVSDVVHQTSPAAGRRSDQDFHFQLSPPSASKLMRRLKGVTEVVSSSSHASPVGPNTASFTPEAFQYVKLCSLSSHLHEIVTRHDWSSHPLLHCAVLLTTLFPPHPRYTVHYIAYS